MCLPESCYVFTIKDNAGDGICCSFGDGNYTLEVDGLLLVPNGGEFNFARHTLFGSCDDDDGDDDDDGEL